MIFTKINKCILMKFQHMFQTKKQKKIRMFKINQKRYAKIVRLLYSKIKIEFVIVKTFQLRTYFVIVAMNVDIKNVDIKNT